MNEQDMGYFLLNVSYANYAAPIGNANIIVQSDSVSTQYISGNDGKTERIPLPSGKYSITVSAIGFFDKTFYDISITDRLTTIINAELFPLYNVQEGNIL